MRARVQAYAGSALLRCALAAGDTDPALLARAETLLRDGTDGPAPAAGHGPAGA